MIQHIKISSGNIFPIFTFIIRMLSLTGLKFIVSFLYKGQFQKEEEKLMDFSVKGPDPPSQHP